MDYVNWYVSVYILCKENCIGNLTLIGFPSAAVTQEITTDALLNGCYVYRGRVFFTCETRGSHAIAWSSEQYIGSGGVQLAFAAGASVAGDVLMSSSNPLMVAILTRNVIDNAVQVLLSELHINVPPNSPPASVTCVHVGQGTIRSSYG